LAQPPMIRFGRNPAGNRLAPTRNPAVTPIREQELFQPPRCCYVPGSAAMGLAPRRARGTSLAFGGVCGGTKRAHGSILAGRHRPGKHHSASGRLDDRLRFPRPARRRIGPTIVGKSVGNL
jgi:hypothetical protein